MPNVKHTAGIVVLVIGLVLHIVGLATPEWSKDHVSSAGLWRACLQTTYGYICGDYIIKSSEIEACEAFSLIGMILGAGSLALAIFVLLKANQKKIISHLAGGCALAAFGSVLIAIIIWGAAVHPSQADIGYSFILSIIGGVIMAIAGPLFFLGSTQQLQLQ